MHGNMNVNNRKMLNENWKLVYETSECVRPLDEYLLMAT